MFLGFPKEDVADCVDWMTPFARAVEHMNRQSQGPYIELPLMRQFFDISNGDAHNIQTKTVNMTYYVN